MKKQILSIALLAVTAMPSIINADEKALMDFFNKETDKFYAIAEKPNELIVKIGVTGGVMFFGDTVDKKGLLSYCESVGGKANITPSEKGAFKPLFEDRHVNVECIAPNNKGFKTSFYRPQSSETGNENAWLVIKFDSPQKTGYYMQNSIKLNNKDGHTDIMKIGIGGSAYYTLERGVAMCVSKGGKYLMSNAETEGYAVDHNDYILAIAHKLGKFEWEYSVGRHWCVDTANKADEFTVNAVKTKYTTQLIPSMGVNRSEIKISTDAVPSYYMKKSANKHEIEIIDEATSYQSNDVMMSTAPSRMAMSLAIKTMSAHDTVLERQSGSVMEGMFLRSNAEGCYLAAVARSVDRPFGHKHLYNKGTEVGTTYNFKQCGEGAPVEYIGESLGVHLQIGFLSHAF